MAVLTVLVLMMDACDLASRQNLNVETDANVTIKSSCSLYAEKIFFICICCLPLTTACPNAKSNCPFAFHYFSLTADNFKRNKDTAQYNPIKKQWYLKPIRRHLQLVSFKEKSNNPKNSYCITVLS